MSKIAVQPFAWRNAPWFATAAMALWTWLVFFPGLLSADGVVIYSQAMTGKFNDWHPPILAFVLQLFLKGSLGLGGLMLLQCIGMYVGLSFLVNEFTIALGLEEELQPRMALCILGVLYSPLFPFPFYAMTFLKDSWCVCAFLWLCAASLHIQRKGIQLERARYVLFSTVLIVSISVAILVRHNTIVLFPLFALIVFVLNRRMCGRTVKVSLVLSALPLAVVLLFDLTAYKIVGVVQRHPERQVFASELVGLIYVDSAYCDELPYICKNLSPNWREAYHFGEVSSVMAWDDPRAVNIPPFDRDNEAVLYEYLHAVLHHPFTMAYVKCRAFLNMLLPTPHRYWFHPQLDTNKYGLTLNDRFSGLRKMWTAVTLRMRKTAVPRIFVAEHLLWLLLNIFFVVKYLRKKSFVGLILLVPLLYYATYLLAATTGLDYRFMYPSTLIVECFGLCTLAKLIFSRES